MNVDDFMDITKPIQRMRVSNSTIQYTYVKPDVKPKKEIPKEQTRADAMYSQKLKQELNRSLYEQSLGCTDFTLGSDDDDGEKAMAVGPKKQYKAFSMPRNMDLPITRHHTEILSTIHANRVTIIKGETGCGKSTQVPQYIVDEAMKREEQVSILVTQPRRIAARTLAAHVARERRSELGSEVGYQIGLDRETGENMKILYCTTGVALRKLVKQKSLGHFTHIILDEVHERDEEMEFLLIVLKLYMRDNPASRCKLILMSATIDTKEFSEYFNFPVAGVFKAAPTVDLGKPRNYKITTYYLDDISLIADRMDIDYSTPSVEPGMYNTVVMLLSYFQRFEEGQLLKTGVSKGVLIFLPGIHEIKTLYSLLKNQHPLRDSFDICMLHSTMSSADQKKAFIKPAPDTIKIILATNMAESSVTLPDIGYVIDFCLTKVLECNNRTGFTTLHLRWASKSSCTQRAGRTGRTMDGIVYRLVYRKFYEREMMETEKPALLRCSLEKIVLKSKMLDLDMPPHNIIGLGVNAPPKADILNAVMILKELRGLHFGMEEAFDRHDGDLTFLGRVMDALPLDIRAARLIVFGSMFSVLEDCIIIAAGLTVQKVFTVDQRDPIKTYYQKLFFADGSGSDLIAILNAYKFFVGNVQQGYRGSVAAQKTFCERHCLDFNGLNEMYCMVNELTDRLTYLKILDPVAPSIHMLPRDRQVILKVCIAGAFYPNLFLRRSVTSVEHRERLIYHELNGRDPCSTIYFRGIEARDHPTLYKNQIQDYLRMYGVIESNDEVKIDVDEGASKIFVTFTGRYENIDTGATTSKPHTDWVAGRVRSQVFKALKLCHDRNRLKLRICSPDSYMEFCSESGLDVDDPTGMRHKYDWYAEICALPDASVKEIVGTITHIHDPNKFWFRPDFNKNLEMYEAILKVLNSQHLPQFAPDERAHLKGKVVAVFAQTADQKRNNISSKFQRAKILSLAKSSDAQADTQYTLHMIDDGEEIVARFRDIRNIDVLGVVPNAVGIKGTGLFRITDIPPRVFEASLAEIQPSYYHSSVGKWTSSAVEWFTKVCYEKPVMKAEVFSLWNGIVSLTLKQGDTTINELMIEKRIAQKAEENYTSKRDRANRHHMSFHAEKTPLTYGELEVYFRNFYNYPVRCPTDKYLRKTVTLRGPMSPLETTVHATTQAGSFNKVTIDRQSVNSVLLDTDPQDPHERLVVATSVSLDETNQGLTLRNTTVMPNIPGFAVTMAMLFAPIVELHRDESKTRYTNLLCGLGYENVKMDGNKNYCEPRFEEHDLSLNLDVAIDCNDLQKINRLRYLMSSLLYTKPGEEIPSLTHIDVPHIRSEIKGTLLDLFQVKRDRIDERHSTKEFDWGNIVPAEMLGITAKSIMLGRAIFPDFEFMRLEASDPDEISELREHNLMLDDIAFKSKPFRGEIECKLCSRILTSVPEIQIHLFTSLHQSRVEQNNGSFSIGINRAQKVKQLGL